VLRGVRSGIDTLDARPQIAHVLRNPRLTCGPAPCRQSGTAQGPRPHHRAGRRPAPCRRAQTSAGHVGVCGSRAYADRRPRHRRHTSPSIHQLLHCRCEGSPGSRTPSARRSRTTRLRRPILHVLQLRPRASDPARHAGMEAGVTDHVWETEEIVTLMEGR
jgi:hypothetical protein